MIVDLTSLLNTCMKILSIKEYGIEIGFKTLN